MLDPNNPVDGAAPPCVVCGIPATVRIEEAAEPGGQVGSRHYCDACADRRRLQGLHAIQSSGGSFASWSRLAMILGLGLGFFGLTADYLGLHGQQGFGWHQQLGVLAGLLMVVVGAAFRIDLLGVAGGFLLVLALFVDYIGLGSSPGIGPRQQITMAVAAALLVISFFLRRRGGRSA